jgi:septal ring factor EnvC (AmiA/AmiB activator)
MQSQQQEHRSTQYKMLLILSAENLSQSYRRMRYLKEYSNWQKEEATRIVFKQNEINIRKAELEKSRVEKQNLLVEKTNEGKRIEEEEDAQQKVVTDLNKKQQDLQKQLQQDKKNADALNDQIERLIAEDIKNSEKNKPATSEPPVNKGDKKKEVAINKSESPDTKVKEVEKASEKPASKETYSMTESELNLAKDFSANKGKLPYPVTGKHTIISAFGQHQHQELSHVQTNNNGIDIQTNSGSDARAIFKGVVTRVFLMKGFNYNVIIRHGDYLTVYSNISQVYVNAGDIVNAQQPIGKVYTDTEEGNETVLHFEIRKEKTKLNPESWIR